MLLLILGAIIFKKDSVGAIIAFNIIQLCIVLTAIICTTIFFGFIINNISQKYTQIATIVYIYFPQYIMSYFLFHYRIKFYELYRSVRCKNFSIFSLIIITIIADFIMFFYRMSYELEPSGFNEIIFSLLGIFILNITIYFVKIEKNSKEINELNKCLEKKINELQKVKHDYGSQLSYLYGLYLMGEHEKLGDSLKKIINGYNDILIESKTINNSSISYIVNGIEHTGINIIINEKIDFNDINMMEVDLQRVLSNILRNAVTAMNGTGVIEIETYCILDFNIIKVKNNGPKIKEDIIDKIFQVGFSTKENKNKDNGFGLSIVKELVEKNNGFIEVESNDIFTEFIIKIPKK
ncbi:MAG: ATP-binding protein [Clostridium celatum]|nr:ATP-binding protein [Clostridium celatum]